MFFTIKDSISEDILTVFVQIVRSPSKHLDDSVSDNRIKNNEITGLAEPLIKCKILLVK